jgi:hypothetical protein
MKPFMRAQLERSVQRLSELDFLLSREDIMKDMTQFMALSREHAEVMALVTPYQKWQHLVQDLAAAQTMLQEADPESVKRLVESQYRLDAPQLVVVYPWNSGPDAGAGAISPSTPGPVSGPTGAPLRLPGEEAAPSHYHKHYSGLPLPVLGLPTSTSTNLYQLPITL